MNARTELATVELVPFGLQHVGGAYLGWLNDKSLMRYSEQRHKSHNEVSALEYFCAMRRSMNPFFAVMEGDRHVGNVAAYIDRANKVADLSILIGEPGRGLGTVAWRLGMEHLWANTDVRKIEAGTMATNAAMLGVISKSGMAMEGRRNGHFMTDEGAVDLLQFCAFRGS